MIVWDDQSLRVLTCTLTRGTSLSSATRSITSIDICIIRIPLITSTAATLLTLPIVCYIFVHFFESLIIHYWIVLDSAGRSHRLLSSVDGHRSLSLSFLRLVLPNQLYVAVRVFYDRELIVLNLLENAS